MAISDQGDAIFKSGNPLMAPHTPVGVDIPAGAVVVATAGGKAYICHTAMKDGELGAVAAGGGIYEMTSDGTPGAGVLCSWTEGANKITAGGAGEGVFYSMPDQGAHGDGDKILVEHVG